MTSKLFCIFAVALTTAVASQAQDRRTLEISETDTVFLNPTSIEYLVSSNSTPSFSSMGTSRHKMDQSGKDETPASMKSVMALLRNHHIAWATTTAKEYSGRRYIEIGDSTITITVHSVGELQSVDTLLSRLSGITTNVGEVEYEPMPDRVAVYKVIYNRALADAAGMASVSGKTLGDLIAAEEPQDPLWSMWQMVESMKPTFQMFSDLSGIRAPKLQKMVEIKMFFKFELK